MDLYKIKTQKFKLIISILAGILCFTLSPYSIKSHIGSTEITIPFSLLFPMAISMAYGWRYGLISALSLGAFFPFYIWTNNGFSNFVTSALYFILFPGIGLFYFTIKHNSKLGYLKFVIFLFLFYTLMTISYRYLFNPLISLNKYYWFGNTVDGLDNNLLVLFALKDSINISILIVFSDLILQLPSVRDLLRLSNDKKKRVNTIIFLSSISACLLIWVIYVALGEALLLHNGLDDGHIQLALLIILAGGFIAARVIIHFFERQIEAKDSLLDSENSLQMQFELMPSACIIWSKEQEIVSWNPAAEKIFGFTENEVVGKKANETILPETVVVDMLTIWKKLFNDEVDVKSLNENITKQGTIIKCEWFNSPLKNKEGEVIGVISMVQDVTESKSIEECLEFLTFQKWDIQKTSFFDAIAKYMSEKLGFDYVFISRIKKGDDKATTISHFKNGQIAPNITYQLKGSPCENVYNKNLCIYPENITGLFPEDVGLVKIAAESYIGQPLWDSVGNPLGLIALISKRKLINANIAKSVLNVVSTKVSAEIERYEAEESLRESEDRLSTLFAAMTEMVVLHDVVFDERGEAVNYRIIDCNRAFTEITGIKKEDAVGCLATEVYQQEVAPYLHEFTQVGITGVPFEYTTYYAPMDKHFMISVVSPKKNVFATITTDITGLKQIQEVITNKNKEMENYLYVASHDLRTPLVNIQGFSQRLQKQTDLLKSYIEKSSVDSELKANIDSITCESIPKTLSFITSNVTKMDSLINGLLQISRTGRMKLTIKNINMNELMANVIATHQFQISEISARVVIDNLPNCYGDEGQINQLFSNLIANAIRYRNKNLTLEIQVKGLSHYNKVIYSIIDNGIGISERHMNKIWDVFFRVDSSAPESGEGLGLCIVKRIVEKHKGRVWVESEEGVGSKFYVELQKNEFTE